MIEEHEWLLKHGSSSQRDTHLTLKIDAETKTVELVSEHFDSVHISNFVLDVLPRYGINAALDESNYENVKNPSWDLIYVFSGVKETLHNPGSHLVSAPGHGILEAHETSQP